MALLCAAFFAASAAASAGYLTVSETFPLEIRAMAIALFGVDAEQQPLEEIAEPLAAET
jgi:hypothetical protein